MADKDAKLYCVICENEEDVAVLFNALDSRGYTWIGGEKLAEHFPTSCRYHIVTLGYQEVCFEIVPEHRFVDWVLSKYRRRNIISSQTFIETCFGIKGCEEIYEESKELSAFLGSFSLEVSAS